MMKESVRIQRMRGMRWIFKLNFAVHILRIRCENLFVLVYWEYAEWICSYTENTRNESVHILRICGTDLYVYGEYTELTKSWISHRIWNQNRKKFRMFIRSLDGFVWPNYIKLKIFCKYTCKLPIRKSNLGLLSDRQRFLSTRIICPQYCGNAD
jgi:hypothetical protein